MSFTCSSGWLLTQQSCGFSLLGADLQVDDHKSVDLAGRNDAVPGARHVSTWDAESECPGLKKQR